jgi:hypothetical protein
MLIEHFGITLSDATSPDNLNVNRFDRVKRNRILSVARLDRFLRAVVDEVFPKSPNGQRQLRSLSKMALHSPFLPLPSLAAHAEPNYVRRAASRLVNRTQKFYAMTGCLNSHLYGILVGFGWTWRVRRFIAKIGLPPPKPGMGTKFPSASSPAAPCAATPEPDARAGRPSRTPSQGRRGWRRTRSAARVLEGGG